MRNHEQNKGRILIDVLMVIAILAVLYSITAVKIIGMQTEAKIAQTKADLKTLKFAIDTYIMRNNVCPKKDDYQRLLISQTPNIVFGNLMDPFGNTMNSIYPFDISSNKKNYVVYSVGLKRNGKAVIGNDGRVLIEGTPIFETNGYD